MHQIDDFARNELLRRVMLANRLLAPVQSRYRVVYENPDDLDAPAAILIPDPNWLAAALHGGVLPPIDAWLRDKEKQSSWLFRFGSLLGQSFAWKLVGEPEHWTTPPIGPMTEEEAIDYLIMKDVPEAVWADAPVANRPRFRVVPVEAIPADRTFRGAWVFDPWDNSGGAIAVDMDRARNIHRQRIRAVRKDMLAKMDIAYWRADESGDIAAKKAIREAKQALRDAPDHPAIHAARTPDDLKLAIPACIGDAA